MDSAKLSDTSHIARTRAEIDEETMAIQPKEPRVLDAKVPEHLGFQVYGSP